MRWPSLVFLTVSENCGTFRKGKSAVKVAMKPLHWVILGLQGIYWGSIGIVENKNGNYYIGLYSMKPESLEVPLDHW